MNSIPKAKVLILFPHAISPPRSGIQLRYSQLLYHLEYMNYKPIIVSFADSPMGWTTEDVERFDVKLISRSSFNMGDPLSASDEFHTICQKEKPDVIINSYVYYNPLIEAVSYMGIKKVIDVNDIISKILKDRAFINSSDDYDPSYQSKELDTINGYDSVLCISKEDCKMLSKAAYLPMLPDTLTSENNYNGQPVFVGYDNEFNRQAIHSLIGYTKYLHIDVDLVGSICDNAPSVPGLRRRGVLEHLGPCYKDAAFSVCPVRFGSGQKVKVLEAMANGLTVVGFKEQIKEPFIDNYYNSFIVDTDDDFIQYSNHLAKHRTIREEMGRRAKEAALSYFTPKQYRKVLQQALE